MKSKTFFEKTARKYFKLKKVVAVRDWAKKLRLYESRK